MGYRNKYGSTNLINKKIDHLSIGWDYDYNPANKLKRFVMFLFTPDMNDTNNHYHIKLNRTTARKLRDWLNKYLDDVK